MFQYLFLTALKTGYNKRCGSFSSHFKTILKLLCVAPLPHSQFSPLLKIVTTSHCSCRGKTCIPPPVTYHTFLYKLRTGPSIPYCYLHDFMIYSPPCTFNLGKHIDIRRHYHIHFFWNICCIHCIESFNPG